jgi:hypothetical protein
MAFTTPRRRRPCRPSPALEQLEDRYLLSGIHAFGGLPMNGSPNHITLGSDQAFRFTQPGTDQIGRIATAGTQNERFISQVYLDLLNRPVDPTGLATWSAVLAQPGGTPAQVVRGIEDSPEYRMDMVQGLYQRYLHRAADPIGLSTFMASLATPGGTPEQVAEDMIASPEYFQTHTTVIDGQLVIDSFLPPLYQEALGRMIDSAGSKTYSDLLFSHGNNFQVAQDSFTIAVDILTSPEYYQDLVQSLYRQLLKRDADPSGLATYVGLLQAGATDQQIIADLAGSTEYFNKV